VYSIFLWSEGNIFGGWLLWAWSLYAISAVFFVDGALSLYWFGLRARIRSISLFLSHVLRRGAGPTFSVGV